MLALLLSISLLGGAQAPTNPPTTSLQPDEIANYIVGPQDVLTVTVFNEPQLSGRFRVENDGQFSYPFIGRIKAGGATLREIGELIRLKLADGYIRDPQVTVEVEQFRSQNVFVMGEVRTPGKYTLTGAVTLIEALAQAGSTTSAAGNEILILHPKETTKGAPTLPDDGDADIVRVNLRNIEGGKLSQNVAIRDGDTIFVPKAERFYVIGLVRNPGSFVLEPNMTVLQAISLAGGVSDRGSDRRIRIIRIVDNKKKEFDAKPTDPVHAGDTVVVRQRLL
jgi:polysaccharide export outer membrane protein